MDSFQQLASAIIVHLKKEISSKRLSDEAAESLEVAVQCIEEAYKLEDKSHVSINSTPLLQIFQNRNFQTNLNEKADAERLKAEGNDFMKAEQYQNAIDSYSQAIQKDGKNAVYYCNRAAAYTSVGNNRQAIIDCESAIQVDPTYGKAYGRMGLAYLNEKDYQRARESYEKAIKIEPNNQTYKTNLDLAKEKSEKNRPPPGGAPAGIPNLGGMDLGSLLSNPAVMNLASNFMQNPQMQNMFANMMGGGQGQPNAASPPNPSSTPDSSRTSHATSDVPASGSTGMPPGFDPQSLLGNVNLNDIMGATQGFAEQMRQNNPELVESLRQQFQQGQHPPNDSDNPNPN